MSDRWDLVALRQGAAVALVFAVPFSIAARLIHDDNPNSSAIVPLVLAAVVGFVLGAGVAAWRQRSQTPLSHGIVAAVGTYAVVQSLLVIINLVRGADIRWFAIFFNLTVTLAAGCMGGLLGMALQRQGLEPRR
ncbi:unannotated protein [freshwater metagenome]|uniref:Unannotated protein n=1 Tax=freshwater metagenome TaxID=449393 RepID=A0A6J7EYA4_9ZZZZ|nr:hypothetical protein [Actinomycetota bacterium]